MTEARCALVSVEQQEPLLGTAPEASALLLVEVRGPWAAKILESDLPTPVRVFLAAEEARHAGLRLQFIRAPRRTQGPIAVYLCRVGGGVSRLELAGLDDLPSVDVGAWLRRGTHPGAHAVSDALTLVCTHGRRDVCCALLGNALYDALVCVGPARDGGELPTVWQTSHLGGHRFAPVVLSLPDGHCYGRVAPAEASAFLAAQAARRVHDPARLRGCTKDPVWLQAAAVALRLETDERDFDALLPGATTQAVGDGQHVTLVTRNGTVRLELTQETHADRLRPASCGDAPSPTVLWRATLAS